MRFDISVIQSNGEEQLNEIFATDPLVALEKVHVHYQRNLRLRPNQYKILTMHKIYRGLGDILPIRSEYDVPKGPNPSREDLTFSRTS